MTNEEANRKLLEWAGFKFQILNDLKPKFRHKANLAWVYPTGEINHNAPNFFHPELGLGLIFKYLVPKILSSLDGRTRGFALKYENDKWGCTFGDHNPESYSYAYSKEPQVALANAILKWLESEKK